MRLDAGSEEDETAGTVKRKTAGEVEASLVSIYPDVAGQLLTMMASSTMMKLPSKIYMNIEFACVMITWTCANYVVERDM